MKRGGRTSPLWKDRVGMEDEGDVMKGQVPSWVPEAWEIEQIEIIRRVDERERREIAEIPVGPFVPVRGWVPSIREQTERHAP